MIRINKIIDKIVVNFMGKSKEIHDEYNKKAPPQNNLYHYTDFKGLKGILESRELWCTDYRSLNDPTEIIFANRIVEETLDQYIEKSLLKVFWQNFKNIYPSIIKICTIYVFSLCEESDYLPAWRWYGDNGAGFSLGFRPSYFKPTEGTLINNPVGLKINYSINDFTFLIKRFLELTNQIYLDNLHLIPTKYSRDLNVKLGGALAAILLPLMPGLKHEGYRHENEYRLYLFEGNLDGKIFPYEIPTFRKFNTTIPSKNLSSNPCVSSSSNVEIPRLKLDKFNYDDICEIWVGPRCDFECAKREIISIFNSLGYVENEIKIKQSKQPYRA